MTEARVDLPSVLQQQCHQVRHNSDMRSSECHQRQSYGWLLAFLDHEKVGHHPTHDFLEREAIIVWGST
jgi:hypothetical protein